MMIKSSLRLIFVLVYKSTFLLSESEKRKHFRGCFVLFNELWFYLGLIVVFFCQEIFLWSEKMGIILQLLLGLFKLFVRLKYWKLSVT